MRSDNKTVQYWNRVADEKDFTFPVDTGLLAERLSNDAAILDLGCGYGRVSAALRDAGFSNTIGLDPAPAMIERGRSEYPDLDLRHWSGDELPFESDTFDCTVLVGVVSCILSSNDRRHLMCEAARVLTPGGYLYISDIPLQTSERYQKRYAAAGSEAPPGTLEFSDGGKVRHLTDDELDSLGDGFDVVHESHQTSQSLGGHTVTTLHWLARVH